MLLQSFQFETTLKQVVSPEYWLFEALLLRHEHCHFAEAGAHPSSMRFWGLECQ